MMGGKSEYGNEMTNIITSVRKVVAPIKTTKRALGIFSTALAALEEVREHQAKRISDNHTAIDHNYNVVSALVAEREDLHDDNANALLEREAAELAIQQINRLLNPAAVAA